MEVTLAKFNYTKSDGSQSDRQILVLDKPSDSYFGIEVDDDLTPINDYLEYLAELSDLKENLRAKYKIDQLKLPYKRFKADGIKRLVESKLEIDFNSPL